MFFLKGKVVLVLQQRPPRATLLVEAKVVLQRGEQQLGHRRLALGLLVPLERRVPLRGLQDPFRLVGGDLQKGPFRFVLGRVVLV